MDDFDLILKNSFKEVRLLKARRFLRCYAKIGSVTGAAKASGSCTNNHYNHWMKDPVYREAFEHAQNLATDELEQIAIDRARKSSDLLLIFLLKARKPEIYREQRMLMGDPNAPVKHEMRISLVRTDSDDRENYHLTPPALGPGTDSE